MSRFRRNPDAVVPSLACRKGAPASLVEITAGLAASSGGIMVEKPTFDKVTGSEKLIYGPRKLLLCGFAASVQPQFEAVLGMMGIADVPKVWVTAGRQQHTLAELLELADGSGAGESSTLPRAVIVSGITEAQLIGLMSMCKKSGMTQALWACLTPVSENWPLQRLLAELAREREAMQKRK